MAVKKNFAAGLKPEEREVLEMALYYVAVGEEDRRIADIARKLLEKMGATEIVAKLAILDSVRPVTLAEAASRKPQRFRAKGWATGGKPWEGI